MIPVKTNIPHHVIYEDYCAAYNLLRERMDYEQNLLKEISRLVNISDTSIIEMAAGTGKITGLLAPFAKNIKAFDLSEQMVAFAKTKFKEKIWEHMSFEVADNMNLPCGDGIADLVIEGWSLGYVAYTAGGNWENAIDGVLAEMERVLRPNGTSLILATLGTGAHDPKPPNKILADLYNYLEDEKGYTRSPWFKTDYKFDNIDEAVELTSFFWSEKFGEIVKQRNLVILPECSAIWYKRKHQHG